MTLRVVMILGFLLFLLGCQNQIPSSSDPSISLTFEKKVSVTPDEQYSYGAFCRVNYIQEEDQFFVTFGGSNGTFVPTEGQAGGAEGGNGYSYKLYTESFEYTGENGVVATVGGDAASVYAEGYYFFLVGDPKGWKILKIDPLTWKEIDSVVIEMDLVHEARNDQMLAYANGYLVASSLYDPANSTEEFDQRQTDPTQGLGTHNRVFTTDLDLVDYFFLEDVPHINASSLIFSNGAYQYVTSDALFGDLIVMQYDEDWNFIDSKTIAEHGNWSQGAVYDETSERYFVSYIDFGALSETGKLDPDNAPNTVVGVYDTAWNLVERVQVTDFVGDDKTHAGRPSVMLADDKLYVSYDVETFDLETGEENKDWQCTVSIYALE